VERLSERLTEARRALASLEELARRRERSVIERDAAIMRFAYTFEAVWKAAQLFCTNTRGWRSDRRNSQYELPPRRPVE
jgi:hypothetical protein